MKNPSFYVIKNRKDDTQVAVVHVEGVDLLSVFVNKEDAEAILKDCRMEETHEVAEVNLNFTFL